MYSPRVKIISVAVLAVVAAVAIDLKVMSHPAVAPTSNTVNTSGGTVITTTNTSLATTVFSTADLPNRDPHYSFSADLPKGWAAEYESTSQGIIFFDPLVAGATMLTKAKVFVQYYVASDFQPTEFDLAGDAVTLNGRSARWYRHHLPNTVRVTPAPGWPIWAVAADHRLVHIKVTTGSAATFYVFHQAPTLDDKTFVQMMSSLKFES